MANQQPASNVVEMKDFDEMTLLDRKEKNLKLLEFELIGELLLKDGLIIPKIKSILTADDFVFVEHKILYGTILKMYQQDGIAPNMLTIAEELRRTGELDKVGYGCVLSLGEVAYTTAYSEQQAAVIKEKSARRKLFRELQGLTAQSRRLSESLLDPKNETEKIVNDAKQIFKLQTDTTVKQGVKKDIFFKEMFSKLVDKNAQYLQRSTGFDKLDQLQIFAPSLIILGATPGAGKTTFAWQLLEQLDALGDYPCLFFSFEMTLLELYSKTLARRLFLRNRHTTLTAASIRGKATCAELEKIIEEESNTPTNLSVFEATLDVDSILRQVETYCGKSGKAPVVVIDYLQKIPAAENKNYPNDKARVDDILRKIKNFQRETQTTFLIISSLNRAAYSTKAQIDLSSFKESGNVEYDADVIWGLQRADDTDDLTAQPRHTILKCLKNRNGAPFYEIAFSYFSAHDYFEEYKEIVIDHTHDDEPPIDDDDDF